MTNRSFLALIMGLSVNLLASTSIASDRVTLESGFKNDYWDNEYRTSIMIDSNAYTINAEIEAKETYLSSDNDFNYPVGTHTENRYDIYFSPSDIQDISLKEIHPIFHLSHQENQQAEMVIHFKPISENSSVTGTYRAWHKKPYGDLKLVYKEDLSKKSEITLGIPSDPEKAAIIVKKMLVPILERGTSIECAPQLRAQLKLALPLVLNYKAGNQLSKDQKSVSLSLQIQNSSRVDRSPFKLQLNLGSYIYWRDDVPSLSPSESTSISIPIRDELVEAMLKEAKDRVQSTFRIFLIEDDGAQIDVTDSLLPNILPHSSDAPTRLRKWIIANYFLSLVNRMEARKLSDLSFQFGLFFGIVDGELSKTRKSYYEPSIWPAEAEINFIEEQNKNPEAIFQLYKMLHHLRKTNQPTTAQKPFWQDLAKQLETRSDELKAGFFKTKLRSQYRDLLEEMAE